MNSIKKKNIVLILTFLCCSMSLLGQKVELLNQSTVTNEGLYFWYPNGKKSHDFAANISPRGDCFTVSDGYIFFGWYRGGMNKRNLMISRKKIGSDKWVHVQLPHTNTLINEKFKPTPYPNGLGNSHQTISVGISKKDNTIHIFYDHHNDPLNYIVSKKQKAFVPDNEFKASIFEKTRENLAAGQKIKITYPELTENSKGDLIVNYRVGTSHAGEETVHSYNGTWTRSKVISTGRPPKVPNNKSNYAYGTPVFANGQFYYAFSVRWDANRKAINEGIYLAKCGPNFTSQWEDLKGKKHKLPIKDFSPFLVDDPATENDGGATSPVTIAVSEEGDVHLSYKGRGRNSKYFYSYARKAGKESFTKKSGFSKTGVAWNDRIYNVITSSKGIITIESTPAGSIDYRTDLRFDAKKTFGNSEARIVDGTIVVIVEDRKNKNTDKQPIYSYEFKIEGSETTSSPSVNKAPVVNVTSPTDKETFVVGQEIKLTANASDPDGNLDKVNFKINDAFYKTDTARPFENSFTPESAGTYKIAAKVFDKDGLMTESFVTINVTDPVQENQEPTVNLTSPVEGAVYSFGEVIELKAGATDPDGNLDKVNFKINGEFYKTDNQRPFENSFTPEEPGTYKIAARAFDQEGLSVETEITITVNATLSNDDFLKSNNSIKLYPSPTKENINLTGLTNKNTEVSIIDISGKTVLNSVVNKNNSQISVAAFANGIYFVKLNNNSSQKTMSFIKN